MVQLCYVRQTAYSDNMRKLGGKFTKMFNFGLRLANVPSQHHRPTPPPP